MEDYLNNKPMPDYEIVNNSYKDIFHHTTFELKHAGETKRIGPKKIPGFFFTYVNQKSLNRIEKDTLILMRKYKSEPYIVLLNGPLCLYQLFPFTKLYYSETITGDLKEFNQNVMGKILKQHNLLEAYRNEYPKFRTLTYDMYEVHDADVKYGIKYFKIIGSKFKP